MNNSYVIEYLNENEFRKKERAIKKYNMLAYKKLLFDFFSGFLSVNKLVFTYAVCPLNLTLLHPFVDVPITVIVSPSFNEPTALLDIE